ncbi:MAG: tyrosine-type recombinase/integrase [Candidatus Nanohaloarchaea archaeon]
MTENIISIDNKDMYDELGDFYQYYSDELSSRTLKKYMRVLYRIRFVDESLLDVEDQDDLTELEDALRTHTWPEGSDFNFNFWKNRNVVVPAVKKWLDYTGQSGLREEFTYDRKDIDKLNKDSALDRQEIQIVLNNIRYRWSKIRGKNSFQKIEKDEEKAERDELLTLLLYDTGMRISELLQIQKNQVDVESNSISVPKEISKSKNKRTVFFTDKLTDKLEDYIEDLDENERLFKYISDEEWDGEETVGSPGLDNAIRIEKEVQKVDDMLRRSTKGLGIDVSPHKLRHSIAQHLRDAGRDLETIQKVLGHQNIDTTQIYAGMSEEQIKEDYMEAREIMEKSGE